MTDQEKDLTRFVTLCLDRSEPFSELLYDAFIGCWDNEEDLKNNFPTNNRTFLDKLEKYITELNSFDFRKRLFIYLSEATKIIKDHESNSVYLDAKQEQARITKLLEDME